MSCNIHRFLDDEEEKLYIYLKNNIDDPVIISRLTKILGFKSFSLTGKRITRKYLLDFAKKYKLRIRFYTYQKKTIKLIKYLKSKKNVPIRISVLHKILGTTHIGNQIINYKYLTEFSRQHRIKIIFFRDKTMEHGIYAWRRKKCRCKICVLSICVQSALKSFKISHPICDFIAHNYLDLYENDTTYHKSKFYKYIRENITNILKNMKRKKINTNYNKVVGTRYSNHKIDPIYCKPLTTGATTKEAFVDKSLLGTMPDNQLAKICNVSRTTIARHRMKAGIKTYVSNKYENIDMNELLNLSERQASKRYNIARSTIYKLKKKFRETQQIKQITA